MKTSRDFSMAKSVQLLLHRHWREIRTWFIIILGIAILFLLFKALGHIRTLGEDNRVLIAQTKQISEDSKALGLQNERLAKRNSRHIQCIAELFAKYTRDNQPITITDLDKCKAISDGTPTSPTPSNNDPETSPSRPENKAPSENKNNNTNTGGGADDSILEIDTPDSLGPINLPDRIRL